MKRLLKALTTLSVFVFLVVLSSCDSNKFYDQWVEAGAAIEEEHIFEYIELDQVKTKMDARENFVVIYGSYENASTVSIVSSFQAQYDYLCTNGEEYVIYVVDSTEITSYEGAKNATESLGLREEVSKDGSPVIITYKNGVPEFESNWIDKHHTQ